MEELYEIKLKKKSFEQELEDTKLQIKRMDEQFEILRKKKAELSSSCSQETAAGKESVERASVDMSGSVSGDVKIIDNKRPAAVSQHLAGAVIEESFQRPGKHFSPPRATGHGRMMETIRVRTNLVDTPGPPPSYYTGKEKQGGHKARQDSKFADLQTQ